MLDKNDENILFAIKQRTDNQQTQCCVNVLTENFYDAKESLEKMDEEEK
ncbi:hypothetical protein [Anaerosporobacter mobilis]|nr:hypothetical protein [Anaerosporobacter mobilis]